VGASDAYETKPFVSVLLKRFRLKVPTRIFAPVNVPVYRIYVLLLSDHSKLKVGFSGNWVKRAFDIIKPPFIAEEQFDLNMSFSILIRGSLSEARELEKIVLNFFRNKDGYQAAAPNEILYFGAGGRFEWFNGFAFGEIKRFLIDHDSIKFVSVQTLLDAIAMNINNSASDEFVNID